MSFLFKNNATSTLASGINNSQTTLVVQGGDGTKYPAPGGSDSFRATLIKSDGSFEIVDVTDVTTDTFTMVRAQEGTAAIAFLSGDRVDLRLTAEVLGDFPQTEGGTLQTDLNADRVDGIHAAASAAANILLALNGSSKLPASITGDSATCSGNAATATLATDSSALGAIAAANYARKDIAQTHSGKHTFDEIELTGGFIEDADATAAGGAITLNQLLAAYFYTPTLTSIPTFTFSNPPSSGKVGSFTLELNNAGGFAPVWPAAVDWAYGVEPVWTTGKDLVTFITRDAGATWMGFAGGLGIV